VLRSLRLLLVTFLPTLRSRLRHGPLRPSWSFGFEWTVRFLRRDWEESAGWSFERLRAMVAARPYPAPHLRQVRTSDETVGSVPVRRFVARSAEPSGARPRIVYLHGGSYVGGSVKHSHGELCAHLAVATGLEVIGVEYRLAPEHPWPAPLEDAVAACESLGPPLLLAGDSAGGHLAVETSRRLATKPVALALLSPWADLAMPGASFVRNDAFDIGSRPLLVRQAAAAHLTGRLEPYPGMPTTFVSIGEVETPRDDIEAFVERLRAAGVAVTTHVARDMPHDPALFAALHPEGKTAFDAAVRFLASAAPPA
jgi:monoterpene epsilon-lactone hydrolase